MFVCCTLLLWDINWTLIVCLGNKPCEWWWSGAEGSRTGLWGTLWQVKSHTHRSSSASSSHEPPNMRQRSCSQLSTPEPDPPEPQSASDTTNTQNHINKTYTSTRGRCPFYQHIRWSVLVAFLFMLQLHLYTGNITNWRSFTFPSRWLQRENQRRCW